MRRRLGLNSQVVRVLHQAQAEVLLPQPIHDDARRQRILGTHQPFCEAEPIVRRIGRQSREDDGHVWLHFLVFVGLIILAAAEDECLPRFLAFLQDHRRWNRGLVFGLAHLERFAGRDAIRESSCA